MDEPVVKQKAKLRIVTEDKGRFALLWQGTVNGDHIFASTAAQDGREVFRFSYHEGGATHFYVAGRQTLTDPRPKLTEISGVHNLATWNPPGPPEYGYAPKPDSKTRRTLVLPKIERTIAVDLWLVESGHHVAAREAVLMRKPYTDAAEGILEVLGTVVAEWTNPQIVAVAWWLTPEHWKKLLSLSEVVPGRPVGPIIWVDRKFYGYEAETGLVSVDLRDPLPKIPPGEVRRVFPKTTRKK